MTLLCQIQFPLFLVPQNQKIDSALVRTSFFPLRTTNLTLSFYYECFCSCLYRINKKKCPALSCTSFVMEGEGKKWPFFYALFFLKNSRGVLYTIAHPPGINRFLIFSEGGCCLFFFGQNYRLPHVFPLFTRFILLNNNKYVILLPCCNSS